MLLTEVINLVDGSFNEKGIFESSHLYIDDELKYECNLSNYYIEHEVLSENEILLKSLLGKEKVIVNVNHINSNEELVRVLNEDLNLKVYCFDTIKPKSSNAMSKYLELKEKDNLTIEEKCYVAIFENDGNL